MLAPRLTFVVHGLAQARTALATVAALGVPIFLRSSANAGLALGAPYFREMIAMACAEWPDVEAIGLLDCGVSAGAALAAFRHQVNHVCVDLAPTVREAVADIAAQSGGILVDPAACQPLIDLDRQGDPVSLCRNLLKMAENGVI